MEIHPIKYKDSIQYILRIMVFRWMISSFVADIFLLNISQEKKNHQQAKLSSRKRHFAYDISFFCHPPKILQGIFLF